MKNKLLLLMVVLLYPFLLLRGAAAELPLQYNLRYNAPGEDFVSISILLPEPRPAPLPLVMPRGSGVSYDMYVRGIRALSADGKILTVAKEPDGPRWQIGKAGEQVMRIEYQVDVARMEQETYSAVDTSKLRKGYAGLLGFSVFAFFDGLEDRSIDLHINAPRDWPILSTLSPKVPAPKSTDVVQAADYFMLADSMLLMGPDMKLQRQEGKIPLFMAVYSEGDVDFTLEGKLAREALDRVQEYFDDTSLQHYTAQLELLHPLPNHDYSFSEEHFEGGSFIFSTDAALTASSTEAQRKKRLFNYAHHIAHCWVPARSYGAGHRQANWEIPEVSDTIWFDEGFGRYSAIEAMAAAMAPSDAEAYRAEHIAGLHDNLNEAPLFIRRMSLPILSREASFLYTSDFRTGMNIYSRGALMAAEMDDRIRAGSNGQKSLRDALRYLLQWGEKNRRAWQVEELPEIFFEATGVHVDDILARWMKPLAD